MRNRYQIVPVRSQSLRSHTNLLDPVGVGNHTYEEKGLWSEGPRVTTGMGHPY